MVLGWSVGANRASSSSPGAAGWHRLGAGSGQDGTDGVGQFDRVQPVGGQHGGGPCAFEVGGDGELVGGEREQDLAGPGGQSLLHAVVPAVGQGQVGRVEEGDLREVGGHQPVGGHGAQRGQRCGADGQRAPGSHPADGLGDGGQHIAPVRQERTQGHVDQGPAGVAAVVDPAGPVAPFVVPGPVEVVGAVEVVGRVGPGGQRRGQGFGPHQGADEPMIRGQHRRPVRVVVTGGAVVEHPVAVHPEGVGHRGPVGSHCGQGGVPPLGEGGRDLVHLRLQFGEGGRVGGQDGGPAGWDAVAFGPHRKLAGMARHQGDEGMAGGVEAQGGTERHVIHQHLVGLEPGQQVDDVAGHRFGLPQQVVGPGLGLMADGGQGAAAGGGQEGLDRGVEGRGAGVGAGTEGQPGPGEAVGFHPGPEGRPGGHHHPVTGQAGGSCHHGQGRVVGGEVGAEDEEGHGRPAAGRYRPTRWAAMVSME